MTFPSKYYTLVFLMAFSLLTHCKDDDPGPLPPATQEGRNTFGCFLNGEPYVPNGRSFTNDMDLVFDPNFRGGTGNVFGSRFNESGIIQRVGFGFNNLQEERQFTYPADSADFRFTFLDFITDCSYASNDFDISLAEGELTITRFDLDARIIAGLFEFTLAKPGCDTIRITEGRFDMKM